MNFSTIRYAPIPHINDVNTVITKILLSHAIHSKLVIFLILFFI